MKLIHKNFLYTGIVTGILTILVLGYFIFMLPPLYVDYMANKNYESIVDQHTSYLKDGSYKNVTIRNPSSATIDIPFSKDSFTVTGKSFQTTISPTSDGIKQLLATVKEYIKSNIRKFKDNNESIEMDDFFKELEGKISEWADELREEAIFFNNFPFTLNTDSDTAFFEHYWDESTKIHFYSKDTLIMEASVKDGENQYTNYIGMTFTDDRIVLSYFPTMTPRMNELRPIVIHSLPMLIAVIIIFALVVSYLYSKGMVDPITKLVRHTEEVKRVGFATRSTLTTKGSDEIAILIHTLNELYEELDDNYKALEHKNKKLEERNKRQEVFLRSSSHQLKTPIAAALLLVEGMINQIGKYEDVKTYLPEVKTQLLSMKKIVEEVLYLNRMEDSIALEMIDLNMLIDRQLLDYQIAMAEHNHSVITDYSKSNVVKTDLNLLSKILANLLSNAIIHSEAGSIIRITTKPNQVEIHNSNAYINEDLIPHIFEPFVKGDKKGHGLGLYIVSYYSNLLGAKVTICNHTAGVLSRIIFLPLEKESI